MASGRYERGVEPIERFAASIILDGACLVWTGDVQANGYGRFKVGEKHFRAHRWIYEQTFGPLPEGKFLDHLCRNRRCVFVRHLEPVSVAENNRRARAANPVRTACRRGHPYEGRNLKVNPNGTRTCRACQDAAIRRWTQNRKAVANG